MGAVPNYEVTIGGYRLREINSINLRLSVTELADSFSVSISDRVRLRAGLSAEIRVDGRVVLVGETMTRRRTKQSGTRDLQISGFSAAQRLVKSSVIIGDGLPKRTVRGLSLRQIVEAVVAPFDLVVDVSESALEIADEPIGKVRVNNGELCYSFLKRVAERQGCILVSGAASVSPDRDAKASVRITRVGVRKSPIDLIYPSPRMLNVDAEEDTRSMHSEILVTRRGNGVRADDGGLEGRDGRAVDQRFRRYQPLLIQARKGGTDEASLQRQAEWELRKRIAEGTRISLNFDGWSPRPTATPPAPLWWPNTLYRFIDRQEEFDQLLLLASVELAASTGGSSARLELIPPDAYAILRENTLNSATRRRGYAANPAWLAQHADLVGKIADGSDNVEFVGSSEEDFDLIFTPEDPDA